MIYNSISEYTDALEVWNRTPARITNGQMFCMVRDRWIPVAEYEKTNTKPVYEPEASDNPDSRKIAPSIKIKKV